jgi:hypothetical protein
MKNDELKTVEVSFHAESKTSFAVLVDKGVELGSWSRIEWFPKKLVTLAKIQSDNRIEYIRPVYFLTAPVWLLEDRKVKLD